MHRHGGKPVEAEHALGEPVACGGIDGQESTAGERQHGRTRHLWAVAARGDAAGQTAVGWQIKVRRVDRRKGCAEGKGSPPGINSGPGRVSGLWIGCQESHLTLGLELCTLAGHRRVKSRVAGEWEVPVRLAVPVPGKRRGGNTSGSALTHCGGCYGPTEAESG
jgi:hypothetical protein